MKKPFEQKWEETFIKLKRHQKHAKACVKAEDWKEAILQFAGAAKRAGELARLLERKADAETDEDFQTGGLFAGYPRSR